MDCFAALAMTDGLQLDCHALENCEVDVRAERSLTSHHKTHPSCPDLIRASINLRQKVFSKKMDHRVKPGDDGLSCYDGQCESAQPQTASFSMATLSKPTFAPAATISCQVVGSTGTPSARRCFFHSRSGSPAIFTWSTPAAGGEAVCQATKLSVSRARFSPVPVLLGSMSMENMLLSTLRLPSLKVGGAARLDDAADHIDEGIGFDGAVVGHVILSRCVVGSRSILVIHSCWC